MNDIITPQYDFPNADLVVGGPPCQPFSVRGKQSGSTDIRNGVPAFVSAVRKIMPRMWIFENVRGMLYKNRTYLEESMKKLKSLGYQIHLDIFNCASYGVPQNRERVVAVGHHGGYAPPAKLKAFVSAYESLMEAPATGEEPLYLTSSMDKYIAVYESASCCKTPRDLHMDKPARTLTCRNLSGCTSDMHRIKTGNGKRRMLYIREAARLQSFPDWFEFHGSRSGVMRQIGNAVPPLFALALGKSVRRCLDAEST